MILKEFRLLLNGDIEMPEVFQQKFNQGKPLEKFQERHSFMLEGRCVAGYMERMRKQRIVTDFWGVNIFCGKMDMESIIFKGNTCDVYIPFPYEDYLDAEAIEKKKYLLDALIRGIEKIGIPEGWDLEEIYHIRDMLIENEYKNEWFWKKRIRRADGKYYVAVEAIHDLHEFKMYINLYNRENELIDRRKVISEVPDEWFFSEYFGKVKWASNTEVRIYKKGDSNPKCKVRVNFKNVLEGE